MFYSAKNTKVRIDNAQFVCSDFQLNYQAQIQPNYYDGDGFATNYSATNGINGSFKFSYYLTGADPIKPFLNSTGIPVINVGGIIIQSGYLKSYGFSAAPNSVVQPTAEIVFFDKPSGDFASATVQQENIKVLNYSNITLDGLSTYSQETLSNLLSINYNYSADIQPIYTIYSGTGISNLIPERVLFGKREIVTDIVCDNLGLTLPMTGKPLGLSITLKHPTLSTTENYKCSGTLFTKNISTALGQPLKTNYTVIQNKVGYGPTITSISPWFGSWGTDIQIFGTDFDNLINVYIGEQRATIFSYSSTEIWTEIPFDAPGNPYVFVTTLNGSTVFATPLSVSQPLFSRVENISNQRFSNPPQAATLGSELIYDISGSDFYSVTQVRFGDTPSPSFEVISSSLIRAQVPTSGASGPLVVVSSGLGYSGSSLTGILFPPYITGIVPTTGITGATIAILGSSLATVSGVRFGDVVASFSIINSNQINAIVPSGLVRRQIYVSGSGYTGLSPQTFDPQLILTNVLPSSGRPNTAITISGHNFIPELMYATGGRYGVIFNNIPAYFNRVSDIVLTGLSPSGYTTGPVFVLNESGKTTRSASGNFIGVLNPELSGIVPSIVYSGKMANLVVNGLYLQNAIAINLSGLNSHNLSNIITIPTRLSGSVLGTKAFMTGYRFTGVLTGDYQVSLNNYIGTGYLIGTGGSMMTGIRILRSPNLALNGIATQSGNYSGDGTQGLYYAYFGNDGIISGTQRNKFLAWTTSGTNPYWQIDLRNQYEIREVKVFNRFDTGFALASPLTSFSVTLYTGNSIGQVYQTNYTSTQFPSGQSFIVPNLTGRFVKIVLSGSNKTLSLSEVEVY